MDLDQLTAKYKQHEVDFLLPRKEGDVSVYLDLYLLYESPEARWHRVQTLAYEYFNRLLTPYRNGTLPADVLVERLYFPEVSSVALGHCKTGTEGRGTAHERALLIKEAIFDNPAVKEVGLEAIARMAVAIEKIGPDLLSDMVAGFAMHYLLEYTDEQVATFGLQTAEFQISRVLDVSTFQWHPKLKVRLPFFASTGEPRVLVPKHLVRRLPTFTTGRVYKGYLQYILKQEMEDQLQTVRTIGKKPKVTLKQVEKEVKRQYVTVGKAVHRIVKERPELFEKYIQDPRAQEKSRPKRRKKEKVNWQGYVDELKAIPPGRAHAQAYAECLRKIFTVVYGEQWVNGTLNKRSEEGLFFYDINFSNGADTPLTRSLRNQNIKAGLAIVEAKNYGAAELGNDEFNQSRGYTIVGGREFIILATRKDIDKLDIARAKRHFLAQRCIILPVSDADIEELVLTRRSKQFDFDEELAKRVQEIMTA